MIAAVFADVRRIFARQIPPKELESFLKAQACLIVSRVGTDESELRHYLDSVSMHDQKDIDFVAPTAYRDDECEPFSGSRTSSGNRPYKSTRGRGSHKGSVRKENRGLAERVRYPSGTSDSFQYAQNSSSWEKADQTDHEWACHKASVYPKDGENNERDVQWSEKDPSAEAQKERQNQRKPSESKGIRSSYYSEAGTTLYDGTACQTGEPDVSGQFAGYTTTVTTKDQHTVRQIANTFGAGTQKDREPDSSNTYQTGEICQETKQPETAVPNDRLSDDHEQVQAVRAESDSNVLVNPEQVPAAAEQGDGISRQTGNMLSENSNSGQTAATGFTETVSVPLQSAAVPDSMASSAEAPQRQAVADTFYDPDRTALWIPDMEHSKYVPETVEIPDPEEEERSTMLSFFNTLLVVLLIISFGVFVHETGIVRHFLL